MEPVIGICGDKKGTRSIDAMIAQVRVGGGKPLFLVNHHKDQVRKDLAAIDALILMGNDFDISPERYLHRYPEGDARRTIHPETRCERHSGDGQARADYEEEMLSAAIAMRMPVLGICGGMQRINVVCGGTLHQHVPDIAKCTRHAQDKQHIDPAVAVIPMVVLPGTTLADIASCIRMPFVASAQTSMGVVVMENSLHHQAVDIIADGLQASSIADAFPQPDGTMNYMVKAIEPTAGGRYAQQFVLGVQWHPEFGASALGAGIIAHLVKEAFIFNGKKSKKKPAKKTAAKSKKKAAEE